MSSNWKTIGKIKDAHGLKGELFLFVFSRDVSWHKKLKKICIGDSEYSVLFAKPHKEGLRIGLEGVTDRNQSEILVGREASVPSDLFVASRGETIYLSEIMGFTVVDLQDSTLENKVVGPIVDFSSNGPQDLLVVDFKGSKVDIPFVEAFIEKIDFESRVVSMNLPPGLLEVARK